MSTVTFGLTLLIVGMGGTLVALYLLTVLIHAINLLFPAQKLKSQTPSR